MLEDWISAGKGVLQKYGNERFVAVTEHRHLQQMIEDRFSLITRVRESFPETDNNITLSMGVGEGATIEECRRMASQALDMALSRGGDQVAVKTLNGYDFFGGQSQGVERRTKVRTRIVADSLRDLITGSDNVIVTGHRMSDLDCLGSAVALTVAARNLGAEAYVCARRRATMAGQLMDRYVQAGQGDLFLEPDKAQEMMTQQSLLIIVDTHSAAMLDAPELYEMAERVVVIDHHRRMVNYIQDAVLTYHESASSSACELVTELLPYLYKEKLGRMEAESLLAGIMLDTRNFVLRTGVRTFEAAAYLRSLGADTVAVKKLFSESLELYRYKNDLVSAAQIYNNTAIAVSEEDYSEHRAAAAQAADDLLTVQGVQASFVVTRMGGSVNISARSFGECNVQLIMESLGGGGHLTMAATQMKDATIHEAAARLSAAIDKYFSTKK
jgi:c-di-AMP phosphodiesterase-like protein